MTKKKKNEEFDLSGGLEYTSTDDVEIPARIMEQIIGQDKSVEIIKKAATQKRNVLLVGTPGTGKSMLAQAMAEILPLEEMQDIMIYPNLIDSNNPKVKTAKPGQGQQIIQKSRIDSQAMEANSRFMSILLVMGFFIINWVLWSVFKLMPDIVYAATMILGGFLLVGILIGSQMRPSTSKQTPKLLINNAGKKIVPFIDATGAKAGALLGDVRHDPLQSGGLGTPPHLRVEPGMIHRANKGILFIDEIATLSAKSQQELLTAMQEKKYSITGQSEMSSGAMVRTDPVPCDFILVAAGNYEDLKNVHPALRSRIRGYGYEIYMNVNMPDNMENRKKMVQFVAQEVKKDTKIPAFLKEAVEAIILDSKRRAGHKNRLTLVLRDLGGLIRAAGDIAKEKGHQFVTAQDVYLAKMSASSLEQQMFSKSIEVIKDYNVYISKGAAVGRVNGLAVSAQGDAGLVLPIEAEVAPAQSSSEGRVIATGKLGDIAKEAVQNVSALFKKISGKDISKYDLHVQFLQVHNVDGDSASISIATAVISSLENIPIKQDLAMTGSLSVRGEVLPVGGVTAKVSAAIEAGFREIIIPKANLNDIVLPKEELDKIKIIPVLTLSEVLENAFVKTSATDKFLKPLKKVLDKSIANFEIGVKKKMARKTKSKA